MVGDQKAAWGATLMLLVIGGTFSYLKPYIGIPILVVLGLVGLYLLIRAYNDKAKIRISVKRRGGKMLIALGTLLIIGGVALVVSQLNFHRVSSTTTTQTQNIPIITNTVTTSKPTTPPKIPTFMDLSKIDPSQKLTFTLGEHGLSFESTLSQLEGNPKETINFSGIPFKMYIANGRFLADVTIYGGKDSNGNIITPIQIQGNEFLVTISGWDKNYDGNAFEVIIDKGNVVFQMIYESQYHIVIKGIFPMSNGRIAWADTIFHLDPSPFDVFHLDPIFKYPSSEYLGQRVGQ